MFDDYDDSDEAAEHDIRAFDLLDNAGLIPQVDEDFTRMLRLGRRLKMRLLESPQNKQRFYFRQELVNGLFEVDDDKANN